MISLSLRIAGDSEPLLFSLSTIDALTSELVLRASAEPTGAGTAVLDRIGGLLARGAKLFEFDGECSLRRWKFYGKVRPCEGFAALLDAARAGEFEGPRVEAGFASIEASLAAEGGAA